MIIGVGVSQFVCIYSYILAYNHLDLFFEGRCLGSLHIEQPGGALAAVDTCSSPSLEARLQYGVKDMATQC